MTVEWPSALYGFDKTLIKPNLQQLSEQSRRRGSPLERRCCFQIGALTEMAGTRGCLEGLSQDGILEVEGRLQVTPVSFFNLAREINRIHHLLSLPSRLYASVSLKLPRNRLVSAAASACGRNSTKLALWHVLLLSLA